MKSKYTIEIHDIQEFKNRVHQMTKEYDTFSYLDSCGIGSALNKDKYELIVGLGCVKKCEFSKNSIASFKEFIKDNKNWYFGGVSYELRKEFFKDLKEKEPNVNVPHIFFFIPETVIYILKKDTKTAYIESENPDFELKRSIDIAEGNIGLKPNFKGNFTKESYIQTVNKIKQDIEEGTYYEVNLCQEFLAREVTIDPFFLSAKLLTKSPAPFSAFCKWEENFLISASPERFLLKDGREVYSQPIKGTQKRSESIQEDNNLKKALLNNEKELAENVMIVDLVRNDLGKVCKAGTIKVPELFGLYSFKHVHQLISTVQGELEVNTDLSDCIEAAFPMGSMTGAPKLEVIIHIDSLEKSGRGLYSGSIGYIDTKGNFDFNVVIRSLLYNKYNKTLSYHVGGAITYDSDPEQEYEECLLKAMGLQSLF